MRSIGKKNKNLVKKLTKNVIATCDNNFSTVEEIVMGQLPQEMFDTWEMAYQEIKRIIDDTIMATE